VLLVFHNMPLDLLIEVNLYLAIAGMWSARQKPPKPGRSFLTLRTSWQAHSLIWSASALQLIKLSTYTTPTRERLRFSHLSRIPVSFLSPFHHQTH
jgi:hypothetical protein